MKDAERAHIRVHRNAMMVLVVVTFHECKAMSYMMDDDSSRLDVTVTIDRVALVECAPLVAA
jgi:hypothetical protein